MGRYLAAGLPTRITIKNRKDIFTNNSINITKDKDIILEKINQYIDLSFYELKNINDTIYLELNIEKANKHLKELLEEINPIMNLNSYLYYNLSDEDIEESLKSNSITIKNEKANNEEKYYLKGNNQNDYIKEEYICLNGAPWLFDLESNLFRYIYISMKSLHLWINFDKFFSEDESTILMILNKFSKSYFKSNLSKAIIFYITE